MPFKFIFDIGLYQPITITDDNVWDVLHLFHLSDRDRYDCYCPFCKDVSIYRGVEEWPHGFAVEQGMFQAKTWDQIKGSGAIAVRGVNGMRREINIKSAVLATTKHAVITKCSRDDSHRVICYFLITDGKLTKVGQYPAKAVIDFGRFKNYKDLLDPQNSEEIGKAIGLISHGIGVGSFVYLRRVFERIIYEKGREAVLAGDFTEEQFLTMRMSEKIKALRGKLPQFLVDNPQLYSILSQGVHELSEDECKRSFNIILESLMLILDQMVEEKLRKKKIAELQQQLGLLKA